MDRVDRFPSTAKFSDIAGIDQVALHCSVSTMYEHLLAAALWLAPTLPSLLNAGQAPGCCLMKPGLFCELTLTSCSLLLGHVPGRQQLGALLICTQK